MGNQRCQLHREMGQRSDDLGSGVPFNGKVSLVMKSSGPVWFLMSSSSPQPARLHLPCSTVTSTILFCFALFLAGPCCGTLAGLNVFCKLMNILPLLTSLFHSNRDPLALFSSHPLVVCSVPPVDSRSCATTPGQNCCFRSLHCFASCVHTCKYYV